MTETFRDLRLPTMTVTWSEAATRGINGKRRSLSSIVSPPTAVPSQEGLEDIWQLISIESSKYSRLNEAEEATGSEAGQTEMRGERKTAAVTAGIRNSNVALVSLHSATRSKVG